jgi:predicted O-linked N-acetylglucosamine transferase (SPINDLY family)
MMEQDFKQDESEDEVEELKPDFDISYMDEVCTAEQKAQVEKMKTMGWNATHIMEHPIGYLNVWLIQRHRKTELSKSTWVHAYVTADGSVKRPRL